MFCSFLFFKPNLVHHKRVRDWESTQLEQRLEQVLNLLLVVKGGREVALELLLIKEALNIGLLGISKDLTKRLIRKQHKTTTFPNRLQQ